MLRELELNSAQQRNSVFEPDKGAAQGVPGRASTDFGAAQTRLGNVPYHPRWAIMQICINLVLWAAIIGGAMLIVPRL